MKLGGPYEQVVAEVLKTMDPSTVVEHGPWVLGPDGLRELDVLIIGTHEDQERRIMVECKDYDPASSGKIGIGHVDALESKARDLRLHFSAICSNAGFTEPAVKKAGRVGIGLISVMKRGDERVRFSVSEEIYTRKVQVVELEKYLVVPEGTSKPDVQFNEILLNGDPVENWLIHRVILMIALNPVVNGEYTVTHELEEGLEFSTPAGPVTALSLDFRVRISGGWYAQQVTLDATHGLYDWIRHRVRLAPGPGSFMIKGVDMSAGKPIDRPPAREIERFRKSKPGELVTQLASISGLKAQRPVPDLDSFVVPKDLDLIIADLSEEHYTSGGA